MGKKLLIKMLDFLDNKKTKIASALATALGIALAACAFVTGAKITGGIVGRKKLRRACFFLAAPRPLQAVRRD